MAYQKIGFTDQLDTGNRYTITPNGDGTFSIEYAGDITRQGTPLSAENFNHIETGIFDAHGGIADLNTSISGLSNTKADKTYVDTQLESKVDKITGKVLSSNDYTNEEKQKLSELEKIIIDSAMSSSSTNPVQNKVVNTALSNKVDKEAGKGLSTNDFTDADKDAISLFSGLTIDYGIAQRDCNNLHGRPIYFNKTFTTLPVVFCTYRGTGTVGNDSYCYCRISDMTLQKFCIELFAYNGNSPSSGTRYFMWFAIGK